MSDFHHVLAVFDSHTDEQVRFAIVKGEETELHDTVIERARIDNESYAKVVGGAPNNIEAKRLHRKLSSEMERWSPSISKKDPHKLAVIEERLPDTPKHRAIVFRSKSKEEQEDFIYQLITRTGAPKTRISNWLGVKAAELDHIDSMVVDAAIADLELRIGQQLIFYATGSKAATGISPSMFLSKALLGWSETGPNAAADAQSVDVNIRVVSNENPELQELRNDLDKLVTVAKAKAESRTH